MTHRERAAPLSCAVPAEAVPASPWESAFTSAASPAGKKVLGRLRARPLRRLVGWGLAAFLAAAAPAGALPLAIEIAGVRQALETNILSTLSLARANEEEAGLVRRLRSAVGLGPKDNKLDEPEIRRLFAQGPDEIREALQPFGYYRPQVRSELRQDGKTWIAHFDVDPGPTVPVASLDLAIVGAGGDDPRFRAIAANFPLKRGEALYHPSWEQGKKQLEDLAAEAGYLDAKFEASEIRVDMGRYQADAVLHYNTGPRYRFGEVRFHQDVLDPAVLEGYVTVKRGEPLDLNKVLELQNALSDSPYWSRVEVVTRQEEAKDLEVPLDVNLVPSKPMRFSGGLGYGTDTGPRASGSWELRRINRAGHRGQADVIVSGIERGLKLSYQIPGHYPRTDVLTFNGAYDRVTTKTIDSETGLLGAQLTRSRGGWRQSYLLTYQVEDFTVGLDKGTSNLLVPGLGLERVEADDRIDTTHGYRLRFTLQGAEEGVLSDASFAQLLAQGKAIRTFGEKNRLIGRADIGYTATRQFDRLPPRFRFFAGGDSSVRGYGYQSLGRLDEAGHVIGGEALLVGSLEYERRFLEKWGAAVFFDTGNAFRTFGDPLERGAGVGLRWRSPIGPIRADVAWALTERGTPLRFHLNIGPDL